MNLQLLAALVLGLMCGSELNIAAFAHSGIGRQRMDAHILMRSSLARLFGKVMPFWMAGSTLLSAGLLLPFAHLDKMAWRLSAISLAIQVMAVIFSLVALVPINNRISKWTPGSLPSDWQAQEQHWDLYHWLRTCGLIAAFALLILSVEIR